MSTRWRPAKSAPEARTGQKGARVVVWNFQIWSERVRECSEPSFLGPFELQRRDGDGDLRRSVTLDIRR